nr:uncharacterized protein LOC113714146 [Coffea arabica]
MRDRGDSIGRINAVHPTEGERYYLRLLLTKVRAPKSFEDLKTYNGVQVRTFREATLLRWLLQDDNNQEHCLEEASLFHMPYELRRLFATLLVYSCPNNPRQLWLKFEAVMSEDFLRCSDLTLRHAFEIISHCIYENKSGAFFVNGPGGTGKSFLYRALLADVRSKGYLALATGISGIAASILPEGRTAHSWFKIPIDLSKDRACRVSKQSNLAAMIRESKLIIWDEAPMSKRSAIEALNDLLQDLMNSSKIFGEKVVIFGGDFKQTLPLTENMRARLDHSFIDYLLRVGNGTEKIQDDRYIKIPSSILLENSEADSISMARRYLPVNEVVEGVKGWIVLAQVVERKHVQLSRGARPVNYHRFLLIDSEGKRFQQ